jgi:hypothetical protein
VDLLALQLVVQFKVHYFMISISLHVQIILMDYLQYFILQHFHYINIRLYKVFASFILIQLKGCIT